MIQNMKVDVIYYSTRSDFEMEFNLCGCCRMRLLTDTVDSQVKFVRSIAKAVKRSTIIITCGPLFGDKGLIQTVSKSTGINTSVIDNKKYSIDSLENVSILDGSTPLVTSDGVFGGCIIENGPQTIIILSESKSIRKKVMKELIYPYITKLSLTAVENSILTQENSFSPVEDDTAEEEALTETDENQIVEDENNEVFENETSDFDASADNNSASLNDYILSSDTDDEDDEQTDNREEFIINTDLDMFISESEGDTKLSFEQQNHSYYCEDSENFEDDYNFVSGVNVRIMTIIVVLLGLAILYFAVAKPIMYHADIFDYLKDLFTLKAYNCFNLLFRG